jgi:hypothetical protein
MRETRAKTGKLPPKKIINYNDPEESEEEIESIPVAEVAEVEEEAIIIAPPRPVFETFSTKTKLESGLCIVRPLKNGKYELVNLTRSNLNHLSSEEIGHQIQKKPELLELLDTTVSDWDQLKLKSTQTLASASKFRSILR